MILAIIILFLFLGGGGLFYDNGAYRGYASPVVAILVAVIVLDLLHVITL